MGLSAFAVWVTGIPSSGKSTIAKALAERLRLRGLPVEILETDELRRALIAEPTFSTEERELIYNVMTIMAERLVRNGINVIFAATGYKRRFREKARERIGNFMEVYAKCPLEVAIRRDTQGLYMRAIRGEIRGLPGLQDRYEEPTNPEVIVETHEMSVEECVSKILEKIGELFLKFPAGER